MKPMMLTVLLGFVACRSVKDTLPETVSDTGITTIDLDGDGYDSTVDCDDNNSLVHPGATELCDGADNDCDNIIDEDVTTTYFADLDGDGFGDPDNTVEACDSPVGHVPNGNDCDDTDANSHPGAVERCDGLDNDCDGLIDEDVTTTYYADTDKDGYGDPNASVEDCDPGDGYVADNTDCNDETAAANPGETEVCDDIDNDCDGDVDEGLTTTYYADLDGDTYGHPDKTTEACELPTGYAQVPGDCDETDPLINPGAIEICDSKDNDCDGDIDEEDAADASTWYADDDTDGYGDPDDTISACEQPSGTVEDNTDCDDDEPLANPAETEVCDEIDNDCDGDIDESDADGAPDWYTDADGDGYGDPDEVTTACDQPTGTVEDNTDCDDDDGSIHPDTTDRCNGIDDDCDEEYDEDAVVDAFLATFTGGSLYEVDPDASSYTELFVPSDSSVGDYSANGLASGLTGGDVYVHDSANNRLMTLDVCDETLTEVGDTNVGNTCGVAVGPNGDLYGVDTDNDVLVIFDVTTGEATEVGDLGFDLENCALTYDCATDTLIGMHADTDDYTGFLFSIDADDGSATEEVTLDSSVTWTSAGLQYDPVSGGFFASTGTGIYEVDFSDGSASQIVTLSPNNLSYVVDTCE